MITYRSRKFWRRSWVAALVGGLAVGGAVWWFQAHQVEDHDPENPVASAAGGRQASGVRSATFAPSPEAQDPTAVPTLMADGRPSDFSADDWSALKVAMANQPPSEMTRVVAYLRFQRNFERWQALADSRDVKQRQELAENLLGQVPERVRKGEVTLGEAQLLGTALLNDAEPDGHRRDARLANLRDQIEQSAPRQDADQLAREAERLREFKRRESAIVSAWQAKPEGTRDPAILERDLEAARRAVYGNTRP